VRTKSGTRGFAPEDMVPLCLPETWTAMEGLYASGQARAIGVSNFSTKKLQDLLKYAKVPPAVNQVECHPVWQQVALHNLCKSTGVHLSVISNAQNCSILFQVLIKINIGGCELSSSSWTMCDGLRLKMVCLTYGALNLMLMVLARGG